MFDFIGFWELILIAVIGIVVIGPKRLPEVVRSIMLILRRMRRMFADAKADIERELNIDEMRRIVQEADMEEHIRQINRSVMDMDDEVRESGKALLRDIDEIKSKAEAMMDVYHPALADAEAESGIEAKRAHPAAAIANDTDTPRNLPPAPAKTHTAVRTGIANDTLPRP